jgi:hypothetical protein
MQRHLSTLMYVCGARAQLLHTGVEASFPEKGTFENLFCIV